MSGPERVLGPVATRLLFENERVRIWELDLPPGARSATHRHDLDYVLVQIETTDDNGIPRIDDESWHLIKETPKVMGFIGGTAERPLPIKDSEADVILRRVQDGVDKPRPKVLFEPGQLVRVCDGPFNDFNGTVEEVNYEKNRLRVAVLIFGRSTPVELEFGQVEKA